MACGGLGTQYKKINGRVVYRLCEAQEFENDNVVHPNTESTTQWSDLIRRLEVEGAQLGWRQSGVFQALTDSGKHGIIHRVLGHKLTILYPSEYFVRLFETRLLINDVTVMLHERVITGIEDASGVVWHARPNGRQRNHQNAILARFIGMRMCKKDKKVLSILITLRPRRDE